MGGGDGIGLLGSHPSSDTTVSNGLLMFAGVTIIMMGCKMKCYKPTEGRVEIFAEWHKRHLHESPHTQPRFRAWPVVSLLFIALGCTNSVTWPASDPNTLVPQHTLPSVFLTGKTKINETKHLTCFSISSPSGSCKSQWYKGALVNICVTSV